MAKELTYTRVLSEDSSFQIVRTNPKLTGNIKFTINPAGGIWMNAIPANLELSKDDYLKVAVDTTKSLAANVNRFFKNGETPSEIIFDLKERVDTTRTSKNFKDQYDFSHYFSGVKYFPSKQYEETLSYFAPLYLKNEVPNYFVILKIKDPVNAKVDLLKQNFENGQTRDQYLIELFKTSTIIKTFDLTPESKIGKFIRDYINNPNFPISPLSVTFEEDQYTKWNGIVVETGELGSKGEFLYDQYVSSTPLKFFEENITSGYERNKIIFPNILNLEFIFDDDTSENYEFNRYLGLYVNSIELSKLDIDLDRAYDERGTWPNTPRLRKRYLESDDTTLIQSNSTGVEIPYKNLTVKMAEFEEVFSNSESLFFNYLTDKFGNFHLPKLNSPYSIDYAPEISISLSSVGSLVTCVCTEHNYSTGDLVKIVSDEPQYEGEYLITVVNSTSFNYSLYSSPNAPIPSSTGSAAKDIGFGKITLSDAQIDLADFFGPALNIFLQDRGEVSFEKGKSHAVIKITGTLGNLDEIRIYHTNGTRQDTVGRYDLLTSALNYSLVPDAGDYYYFNDYDNTVGYDTFYFNGSGQLNEISSAIASCINNIRNRTFSAYALNEYLFIKCNSPGDFDALHKISFYSFSSNYSVVTINEKTGNDLVNSIFNFRGGDKFEKNKLVVDREHFSKLSANLNNLLIKTNAGWSKIKKLSSYADLVNESTYIDPSDKANAIAGYENKILVLLEDNETPTVTYGEFIIRSKFRPAFGLISLFPIKDIDFDFYSSDYLNFPIIDLYQHYYVPQELNLLEPGINYQVVGGTIQISNSTTSTQYSNLDYSLSPYLYSFDTNYSHLGQVGFFSTSIPPFEVGDAITVAQSPGATYAAYDGAAIVDYVISVVGGYVVVINKPFIGVTPPEPGAIYSSTMLGTFSVNDYSKYTKVSGNPIVIYHTDASINGSSLAYPINDENKELNDFPGFSILKDPSKVVPQENTLIYSLQTKYLNGLTETEYDYYKENASSDFATRSKIIPYITKWRIKNGLDSRDNPYRLNTELIFGRNNFSPDHTDRSQNPNNFTHEWFYLESKFNYLNDSETVKLNSTYFDTPLNMDKLLSDPDYFTEYFTYTPSFGTNQYGEPINVAPTQFRYANVFKNKAKEYETFIKGFKLLLKDVTDPTVLGEDLKPISKSDTFRFEDYKFSCILKTVREDFSDPSVPPIRYRCIEHRDYKWMLVVIELSLGEIDQIADYWESEPDTFTQNFTRITNVQTVGSPTSDEVFYADPNYSSLFGTDLPIQTVNGDYRFKFEQIDGMEISNISHALIYSLKHKKFNNTLDNFSNVKLSSKLNITSFNNGVDYVNNTIGQVIIPSIENYPSLLSDEIIIPNDKTFITIKNELTDSVFFIDQNTAVPPIAPENINPISGALESIALFSINSLDTLIVSTPISVPPYIGYFATLPLTSGLFNFVKNNYTYSVSLGGEKYYEKLFEKLSFSKFKKYVNELNPIIEYVSYSLDSNGISQENSTPNFYIEVLDQSIVAKQYQVIATSDEDRPTQYAFDSIIGYQYQRLALNNSLELNRFKGEYEPIVKSILHCKSTFKFNKNEISELKLSNTKLNTAVLNLMTVQNFSHIKVANTRILDLEADTAYSPRYPLIDEVAIGRADYFLLRGNWDWGFHQAYSNRSNYAPVAGSIRVEEDECFLGKIIKVPLNLELENFKLRTLAISEKLEDVNLDQIELVVKENAVTVTGYINLNNVLTRYLIESGFAEKFNEYLVNSDTYIGNFDTIESYVREYIKLNILKLYSIETNEFYIKRAADVISESQIIQNSIVFDFLNDAQRFDEGFQLLKGVQINKLDRLIISFSIRKNLDAGLRVSPKIKIKFT